MRRATLAASCLFTLSACGGALTTLTPTVIQVPTPPAPPAGITPTSVTPAGLTGGFTYGIATSGSTAQGYANLLPTTFRPPTRTSGTATLTGRYDAESVPVLAGVATGIATAVVNAPLTLTATFNGPSGQLTGNDGNLFVNGQFANGVMTGSVTYQGIPTTQFQGVVSDDRAVGAFIGTSTNRLYAGGFDVNN